ncbi:glycosyltransferase [Pedobacter sp. HMF7647]|uniref:Glycosyltransferase n=1 Tax=Hufsiella arboris TaxID=2695275 RepID=A0A7K1YB98_9SPHI|nr:glycosyltransferase family 2 protein [Hufsiella arboris]MXV51853.1 glycosyltransferase [Hufsiella arboris]
MILLYLIFCFLILRFSVTVFNFISNPKLPHSPRHYHELVSVLIPARDEANDIVALLTSLKIQDYQHIEVIILNDNSSDDTYTVCREFCSLDSRFKIINGKELPAGWLGKNFACHQLAENATGKYLLFMDADEQIADGAIEAAIHRMRVSRLSLLSLFTNQVTVSLGEKLVVPLMHFILLNLLPLRLVRLSRNASFAAASGQFMFFKAEDYRLNKWHEQVKNKVVEDIEIMKLVKSSGYNGEALLANGFVFCRMYKTFDEAISGFGKNLLAGFNNSIAGLLFYEFLIFGGQLYTLYYMDVSLLLFAITLIILSRVMISLLSGQSVIYNVILHPFQMIALLTVAIISIKNYLTNRIVWKGRIINPG